VLNRYEASNLNFGILSLIIVNRLLMVNRFLIVNIEVSNQKL